MAITKVTSGVMDIGVGSDAQGDILFRGASNYERLAKGNEGQVLTIGATAPRWSAGPYVGRRNLIVNSGMRIVQRSIIQSGTSHAMAHDGSTSAYFLDRFSTDFTNMDTLDGTVAQVVDAPSNLAAGEINTRHSYKWTTGTAETAIAVDENFYVRTRLMGQDLQHLQYGAANAKKLTLSFWVKSSITGTYAVNLHAADGARVIGATYAISSASTWERKTITFAGDTGGTMNDDANVSLQVSWTLAAGTNFTSADNTSWSAYADTKFAYGQATNAVATTASATWQLTAVQLEVDESATPYENRSRLDDLNDCHRYYYTSPANIFVDTVGAVYNTMSTIRYAHHIRNLDPPVVMRATPSASFTMVVTIGGTAVHSNYASSHLSDRVFSVRNNTSAYATQGDLYITYTLNAEI